MSLGHGVDACRQLTITGSVGNIIVVETAKPEVQIGYRDYLGAGVPTTVLTSLVG